MYAAHSPSQLRRMVRARICAGCPHCTPGYEPCSPDVARPCEGDCAIFRTLPILQHFATQMDPMLCPAKPSIDRMIRDLGRRRSPGIDWPALRSQRDKLARVVIEGLCG